MLSDIFFVFRIRVEFEQLKVIIIERGVVVERLMRIEIKILLNFFLQVIKLDVNGGVAFPNARYSFWTARIRKNGIQHHDKPVGGIVKRNSFFQRNSITMNLIVFL